MTLTPEFGRLSILAVKGGILMRSKPKAFLSSILLVVFVLSMVVTIYTTSDARPIKMHVCCTKVLANGTVIEGVKRYGMPDATCSYDLCLEVGEFCTCSITK